MVRKEPYDELKLKYISLFHNDWNDVYAEDILLVISTKQPDELLQILHLLVMGWCPQASCLHSVHFNAVICKLLIYRLLLCIINLSIIWNAKLLEGYKYFT